MGPKKEKKAKEPKVPVPPSDPLEGPTKPVLENYRGQIAELGNKTKELALEKHELKQRGKQLDEDERGIISVLEQEVLHYKARFKKEMVDHKRLVEELDEWKDKFEEAVTQRTFELQTKINSLEADAVAYRVEAARYRDMEEKEREVKEREIAAHEREVKNVEPLRQLEMGYDEAMNRMKQDWDDQFEEAEARLLAQVRREMGQDLYEQNEQLKAELALYSRMNGVFERHINDISGKNVALDTENQVLKRTTVHLAERLTKELSPREGAVEPAEPETENQFEAELQRRAKAVVLPHVRDATLSSSNRRGKSLKHKPLRPEEVHRVTKQFISPDYINEEVEVLRDMLRSANSQLAGATESRNRLAAQFKSASKRSERLVKLHEDMARFLQGFLGLEDPSLPALKESKRGGEPVQPDGPSALRLYTRISSELRMAT